MKVKYMIELPDCLDENGIERQYTDEDHYDCAMAIYKSMCAEQQQKDYWKSKKDKINKDRRKQAKKAKQT